MSAYNTMSQVFFKDDMVMSREYGINHLNNEPFGGFWVVRNKETGEYIDNSRYSNDLIDKYGFNRSTI